MLIADATRILEISEVLAQSNYNSTPFSIYLSIPMFTRKGILTGAWVRGTLHIQFERKETTKLANRVYCVSEQMHQKFVMYFLK